MSSRRQFQLLHDFQKILADVFLLDSSILETLSSPRSVHEQGPPESRRPRPQVVLVDVVADVAGVGGGDGGGGEQGQLKDGRGRLARPEEKEIVFSSSGKCENILCVF